MARRYYKLLIYPRGVVSTTGAPSYTLGSSYFRDAPLVGGQIVRAAQCLVESNPWRVTLVDVGSTFTAKIANSSGRLHLLGRICQLQSALNTTASFAAIGTGRLTDLSLNGDVASWDVDIADERWVERQVNIFPYANTMAIVPYGAINGFHSVAPLPKTNPWRVVNIVGNAVCLRYDGTVPIPTSPEIAQLVVNDLAAGVFPGNTAINWPHFTTLRFRNLGNATDYQIGAFGGILQPGQRIKYPTDNIIGFWAHPDLLTSSNHTNVDTKVYVWLVWAAAQPTLDTNVNGYLYAPTHEPTEAFPQLIGGSSGLHPLRVARNAYNGTYSTGITVRISTAAFDTLENESAYGRVWFRITKPDNMATFLDERIYAPYQVAPVVDSSGKIAPKRMWLPTSTQVTVGSLGVLTSTNLLKPPTWENPSREAVTAIRYTVESYPFALNPHFPYSGYVVPKPTTIGSTFTADTLSLLGRRQLTFRLGSVMLGGFAYGVSTAATFPPGLPVAIGSNSFMTVLAKGIFHRFADGPIYSQVECTSAIDLFPGDYVKLTLGIYPNPLNLARTGTRILQTLKRDVTPRGRAYHLLDVGSTLGGLTAPTIALVLSSRSSRHGLKVTAASVPVGAEYEVHLARTTSTGASVPAANSNKWFPAAYNTTGTLVTQVGQLPSNTKIFGRIRAVKNNRIGSPWSTASVSAVTAKIAGPSALSVGTISAGQAVYKWTNGSSVYGVEAMIDTSTAAVLASSNVVAQLPVQTTRYTMIGTNSGAKHKAGVRHFDVYGGRSTQAVTTWTATTSYTTAPPLRGLVIAPVPS